MISPAPTQGLNSLIAHLAEIANAPARRIFLQRHPEMHHPSAADRLYDQVVRLVRVDLQKADRLARSIRWISVKSKDEYCRALACRAAGHVLYANAEYSRALAQYQEALAIFKDLGRDVDVARTLSGALHTVIYLGRYRLAFAWAKQARAVFEKQKDLLRLGRLDSNIGNILYRQDRLQEALAFYKRAYDVLRRKGQPSDVAAVLSNMAVCWISLNEFEPALRAYRQARAYCERHGMPLLVAEADYNIAYLYYLRGEYTRAIAMYQAAYAGCKKLGDRYHMALCDLDQSEMYLELNLNDEGSQLAQRALEGFEELGMSYEGAKAMTNLAVAASQSGHASRSLELFGSARKLFVREQNQVWPALIDLYLALVLYRKGRYLRARGRCLAAFRFFSRSPFAAKAALCELVLARLHLQTGKRRAAYDACIAALKRLKGSESPNLNYQAYFTLGQVQEAMGGLQKAYRSYRKAHALLEKLRSHLQREELKIAFMKDKLAVYESLVWISLNGGRKLRDPEACFGYIEQAKSRSLADLIAFHVQSLPAPANTRRGLATQVRKLREQINWHRHRIRLQGLQMGAAPAHALRGSRDRIRECEQELAEVLARLPAAAAEYAAVQSASSADLAAIRSAMPGDAVLLEYYKARDVIHACVLSRDKLDIVPVCAETRVRDLLQLLQFQLTRFRYGAYNSHRIAESHYRATQSHLADIYDELLAPVRRQLRGRHLIVVPHDFLHYLPFHALYDGSRFLIDDFAVSYAPSASVYLLCCKKKPRYKEQSLILGIPDPLNPHILEEVEAVAASLPDPRVFTGAHATRDRLTQLGATSRFVHVATHGLFSPENAMFSSIRLGDSELTLLDLYQLRLSCELATLSGCSTGLNVAVGGDELLGLVRGLLYAGAETVLASLWDVNDQSTSEFMKLFYRSLQTQPDKAIAARTAIHQLRKHYPHPYHWAPFIIIGKFRPIPAAATAAK